MSDRREYWRTYYQKNRERVRARQNKRYHDMKAIGIQIIQYRSPRPQFFLLFTKVARALSISRAEARSRLGIQ